MRKRSKFKLFVLGKYWRFVAFSIVIYPAFLLISIYCATKAAVIEFLDTDFTLEMDRKTYARLRRNYGVDKK